MKESLKALLKGPAGKFAAAVLAVCVVLGLMQIVAGLALGLLLVLLMMGTLEAIPGFWAVATRQPGKFVVILGTMWLAHVAFGGYTIVGMTATAFSGVLKILVIDGVQRRREAGRRGLRSFKAEPLEV